MKRIAKHINTYCTFCKAAGIEKQPALWRVSYDIHNRACEAHRADLQKIEEKRNQSDDHLSEADYQTWMRL